MQTLVPSHLSFFHQQGSLVGNEAAPTASGKGQVWVPHTSQGKVSLPSWLSFLLNKFVITNSINRGKFYRELQCWNPLQGETGRLKSCSKKGEQCFVIAATRSNWAQESNPCSATGEGTPKPSERAQHHQTTTSGCKNLPWKSRIDCASPSQPGILGQTHTGACVSCFVCWRRRWLK